MERIKDALERARQERSGFQSGEGKLASDSRAPSTELSEIVYTKTRTVDVSESVMRHNRLITGSTTGAYADGFKILRTQVLHRMDENNWNSLALTSAQAGEGTTVAAINLAISLAMEVQRTVLLVDANLRNPGVHQCFGLSDMPGLTDFLMDDAPLSDLLINPAGIDRFVVLPGGRNIGNTSELLSSPKMGRLVEELKARYPQRLVLFDLPPVLTASDALAFSPYVDAALLVIGEGGASASDVQHAAALLEATNLIGTVLNRAWGTAK